MFKPETLFASSSLLILALLTSTIPAAAGAQSAAQSTVPAGDPAFSALAAQLARPLNKAKGERIAFFDLDAPDHQQNPAGAWLADQISRTLQNALPDAQSILRLRQKTIESDENDSQASAERSKQLMDLARKADAKIVIYGSYAKISKGIGISLSLQRVGSSDSFLPVARGLVPISAEITALSPDPIPSFKGLPKASIGGTSTPSCTYCPSPSYSSKARAAKYQGTVTLLVTVAADGHSKDIRVVKGPGMGLEEKSIDAVKRWKFKPAVDAAGDPVDVIVPIEITFRFY